MCDAAIVTMETAVTKAATEAAIALEVGVTQLAVTVPMEAAAVDTIAGLAVTLAACSRCSFMLRIEGGWCNC